VYITKNNQNLLGCMKNMDVEVFTGINNLKKFVLQEIKNLNSFKHIVIDIDGLADEESDIIDSLVAIKRMYNVRITIVALGYVCNASILGMIFNEGIYNFVTANSSEEQEKELIQCLTGEGMQYKDAIKYRADIDNTKGKKILVKKEYSKLKQYVHIGVVGTQNRIGTTTQALLITKLLKDLGFNVCYIEANDNNHISKLGDMYEIKQRDSYMECMGLDLYQKESTPLGYDFYIYDYGVLNNTNFELLKSRDLQIVVAGTKVWEQDYLLDLFYMTEKLTNVHYIFSFAPEEDRKEISKNMGKLKLKSHFSSYIPNPFGISNQDIYYKILKEYISERSNKVEVISKENIFSKLFGKR